MYHNHVAIFIGYITQIDIKFALMIQAHFSVMIHIVSLIYRLMIVIYAQQNIEPYTKLLSYS